MMAENNSADDVRWGQHPVISTVLWILGSEKEKAKSSSNSGSNNSNSHQQAVPGANPTVAFSESETIVKISAEKAAHHGSSLKWKDLETGGCINEYFSQVQIRDADDSAANNSSSSSSSRQQDVVTQLPRTVPRAADAAAESNVLPPSDVGSTVSPQWGFYVPITPPEAERYSSISKADSAGGDSSNNLISPQTAANTAANTWI